MVLENTLSHVFKAIFIAGGNQVDVIDIQLNGVPMSDVVSALASTDYYILGDANKDHVLNMQDVTYTELVILEYYPETVFADAKYDGSVDILDTTYIELLILGNAQTIWIGR